MHGCYACVRVKRLFPRACVRVFTYVLGCFISTRVCTRVSLYKKFSQFEDLLLKKIVRYNNNTRKIVDMQHFSAGFIWHDN